ncbi:MAG: RNA methyltransferase [Proteobacteria bacterium]|jgi:tRNA/rRNA methyltransferase|nr:RNA methyltransferase [Pseudomonadota bacterium]
MGEAGGARHNAARDEAAILPAVNDATRFVLVQPSHAANVGAAARAMKVMGFHDLVLVAPRHADVLVRPEAAALASGALDVLGGARVVDSLGAALQGVTWACATAMTPRDFGPPTCAPREHLPALASQAQRVAFVFGPERTGLANDDVYRCHACLSIPTHPAYGSLNLAQAVQLVAYEWRLALGGYAVAPRTAPTRRADAAAVQGALEHWQRVLVQIGFLDPAAPRKLMPRLQQLLNRAQLTEEEVHILRGIARAVSDAHRPRR